MSAIGPSWGVGRIAYRTSVAAQLCNRISACGETEEKIDPVGVVADIGVNSGNVPLGASQPEAGQPDDQRIAGIAIEIEKRASAVSPAGVLPVADCCKMALIDLVASVHPSGVRD